MVRNLSKLSTESQLQNNSFLMKSNRVKPFKLSKIQKGKCYKLIIIIIYKIIGLK